MKQILVTISLSLIVFTTFAQEWNWAQAIKGSNGDLEIYESTFDSQNNLYALGYFSNELTDIMNESNTISTSGDKDIFLAKFDEDGTPLWLRLMQSAGTDVPKGIAVDDNDNVYVIGDFKDNDITIASPSNTVILANQGKFDIFIAKYSSAGELSWAKNVSWGTVANVAGAIQIDNSLNRILFSGWFRPDNNFGDDFLAPTATINAIVRNGVFIANLDLDGNYISNFHFEMPNNEGAGNIVDIQVYNNAYYLIGKYTDQIQLETTLLSTASNTEQDAFIYKTDLNFNEIWVQRIHGSSLDYISSSVVNADGIFVGGHSASPILTLESASGPAGSETLSGTYDIFMAKYDTDGNFVNSNAFVGAGANSMYSTSYKDSKLVFSGEFTDQLIIAPDTLESSNPASTDMFWIITDNNVDPYYAGQTDGTADDRGVSAFFDNNSDLLISGSYSSDPVTFASEYSNDVTLNVASIGFSDGFMAKQKICSDFDVRFFMDSISCPSGNDGRLNALVFRDETVGADTIKYTWTYNWSTMESNDTIFNLTEGWYYLTLSNRYGCSYTDSAFITNNAPLQASLTDTLTVNCFYDVIASDTIFASLGQRPYTYQWANTVGSSIDSVAYDLPVGKHYVTVTDACGTTIIDSISIGNIPTLTSTISTHNTIIACENGQDGEAWMNTNNGFGTITYEWENSSSTDYIASDLGIGLHHVTVSDACITIIDSVNVVNLPSMNASITSSTPATCTGNNDGTAFVFVVGGVQPYTYEWSSGETGSNQANMLPEGWAYVTVTDACGSVVDSVEITVEPSMTIALSANHETCAGGNGEVYVVATNGSGNYSFAWDTLPSAGAPISVNDTVSNLSANTYYVTVTDACGSKTDSITLTNSPMLEATLSSHSEILSCDTSTNGSVTVIANNGVEPYTYTWSSSSSTSSSAYDLGVGTEYVTITDQCNNQVIDSIIIGYTPELVAFAEYMSDASCVNTNDGAATVIATGGVQPYTFAWSNSASTSNMATDLPIGTQYVTVTDYCGIYVDSVEIGNLPPLSYSLTATAEQCSGDSLAYIIASVSNGVPPYTYDWGASSSLDTNYIDSLWSGVHYVTISDICNNPIIDSIEILNTIALDAYLADNSYTVMCETSNNGRAEIVVSGGQMPYEYIWSNGETTNSVTNLTVGLHYASVTDQCNDTIVDSVYVSHLPAMDIDITSTEPLCYNDSNGVIQISISQGIYPYELVWMHTTETTETIDSLKAGTYKFTITDQCGAYSDSIVLANPDSISLAGNVSNETISGAGDGIITVVVDGGTSPFSFSWSNGTNEQDLYNLSSGFYTVNVLDYNNCSSSTTFELKTDKETIDPVDAFTPNGDGVNETWTIRNIEKFPNCTVKIFNQWGNLVYESTGYDEPWDGMNSDKNLSSAVYYYIIDLKNGQDPETGSITLLR